MLILSRKINQSIVIGGNIRVTMTTIRNRHVRLAIEAPPGVRILREELFPEDSGDVADGHPPPVMSGLPDRSGLSRPRRPRHRA